MSYGVEPLSNLTALVASCCLLMALLWDVGRDVRRLATARSVVLLSVFAWFLFEAVLIPEDVQTYPQATYDWGVMLVCLATGTFLLGYHNTNLRLFDDLGRRVRRIERPSTVWFLFVAGTAIGLAAMAVFVNFRISAFAEGLTGLQQRWSDPFQRGRYGGLRDAILELTMFMRAVVPLGAIILLSRRFPATQRLAAGVIVAWLLLRAINSGHRSQVLPLFLPVAAAVYWKASPRNKKRLLLFGLPVGAVVAFLFSAIVVAGRNEGEFDTAAITDKPVQYIGFEMFRELLYISENVPEPLPYQLGMTYYTQLVNPIPRFLWPGKPALDAGLLLARAKGLVDSSGRAVMTNSPGFLGECYLNFGFFGVLVIPFIAGAIVRAWDRLLPYCRDSFVVFVVYAAGLATMFLSGRSFNMATFYALVALYGLLVLMQFLGDRRFDPRLPPPGPVRW